MQKEVEELTLKLQEAHEKNERAMSMAQQTRAGYVYIISNLGSFGEHVFKIGMTRRLDPMERVKELGDASVPFEFDVHALIPSLDAPALEKKLHTAFEKNKMNLINNRREFFRLDDIEELVAIVKQESPEIGFVRNVPADQYRRSEIMRQASTPKTEAVIRPELDALPEAI